jgi:hypothetical protein
MSGTFVAVVFCVVVGLVILLQILALYVGGSSEDSMPFSGCVYLCNGRLHPEGGANVFV